jgi:putative CocE/NonD family hydrolase
MRQKSLVVTVTIFILFTFAAALDAQFKPDAKQAEYLKKHYTKKEYRITMRDGIKLFTSVYSPRGTSKTYPILLRRTPYSVGPYGEDKYPSHRIKSWHHFAAEGFIIVFQDVRGRFMSEGTYLNMRPHIPHKKSKTDVDESTDTYDTIDWLVKNLPGNNGKVGMWGISYPGFYAAMGAIGSHPALKAVSPQAPISDWFIGDDVHHNGALSLSMAFGFFSVFGKPRQGLIKEWPKRFEIPTPDGYDFFLRMGPVKNANEKYLKGKIPFWNKLLEHGAYDEFWQSRNSRPHFKGVRPAVMTVGGFFDAENAFGSLQTYQAIETLSPGANNILVMGPWFHGGWVRSDGSKLGDVKFRSKTGAYYVKYIELPFFNYYLKGKGVLNLPEAKVFETGRNQWQSYSRWPPAHAGARTLYLHKDRSLSFKAPMTGGAHTFTSDPARPVPFTSKTVTEMPRSYMVEDQRFSATRPDVLVYETAPLNEEVTIAGPVTADLYVSTSGSDSDWIVKLIDVYPGKLNKTEAEEVPLGGYQMMLRGDIMRGKFRNSFETPEPMIPGKVTRVRFAMNDLHHTFRKGHKIMVHIQCSWFPLYDRNPQTFTDIYKANEKDFKAAAQKVYFSTQHSSGIILKVLER